MATFEQLWEAIQVGGNGNGGGITFGIAEQKTLNVSLVPSISCIPREIPASAVFQYRKRAAGREEVDWYDAFYAANADEREDIHNNRLGHQLPPPYAAWLLWRCVAQFDIPAGTLVDPLYPPVIAAHGVSSARPVTGVMKDASTLLGNLADYGDMLQLPDSAIIGSFATGAGYDQDQIWYAQFNEAGCALINSRAGATMKVALYHTEQPATPYEALYVNMYSEWDPLRAATIMVNCPALPYHFTPSFGSAGDSVDGTVIRQVQDQLWDELRLGEGTGAFTSGHLEIRFGADASAHSDHRWDELSRVIMTFPTQATAPATIVSAKLRLYCLSLFRQLYNQLSFALYPATPLSNNNLLPEDYQHVGDILCSPIIPFELIPTSRYIELQLNNYGLQQINFGGITAFALREATYDVGGVEPPSQLGENWIIFAAADYPNVDYRPTLIVEVA